MLSKEPVVAQDITDGAVVREGNSRRGDQTAVDARGEGSALNEFGKGRDSSTALDEGMEGRVEAEVGEVLEVEVGIETGADNPGPIGGVNTNVGNFEEEIHEINTVGTVDLGFHESTVHVK
jgi:hypothetical protein